MPDAVTYGPDVTTDVLGGPVVALLEDSGALRESLRRGLRAEGMTVRAAATGTEFLDMLGRTAAHVMVIDIGLPDADGRDVAMAARALGHDLPVLFLTARSSMADRLAGFNAGGDDYMVKPFEFDELVARIRALTRRANGGIRTESVAATFDPVALTVAASGVTVTLTPTEFRLVTALAGRETAVSRRDLVRAAWPPGAAVSDNTLDSYIARVRRKLRPMGDMTITTVHRVGYRMP